MRDGAASRIFLLALVAVAVTVATLLAHGNLSLEEVAQWVGRVGDRWWAPLAFIAIYTIFNLLLAPATALTLTAGVLWGWLLGGVCARERYIDPQCNCKTDLL